MGKYIGRKGKVVIGTTSVVAIGTWTLNGVTTETFAVQAFGDAWIPYLFGMHDNGDITFNGWCDMADTTGQQVLIAANCNNSALNTMKFYLDNTSYFEPCQTTGYLMPGTYSTGMSSQLAELHITGYNIGNDKSGVANISFTAKVSGGPMALV